MNILAIETSCDDTSAAVLAGREILSNVTASQDAVHAPYGGVVPELAARRHLETISRVVASALEKSGTSLDSLDALAVTRGPGLVGSLLVGVSAARGLALKTGLPLHGVHHLEGHALSPLVHREIEFPFLSMVVSGGHSSIYVVRAVGDYEEIASTRDDSAGEAFDKGAKMLGLGYPGGKLIDDLATQGNPRAVAFPRGRVKGDPLALSFSGLKTALWDYLSSASPRASVEDICASFQEAIVDVLVRRATMAMELAATDRIAVAGGVSANSRLRARMQQAAPGAVFPPMSLCTDNAAMIGYAAVRRLEAGLSCTDLDVRSRLPLGRRASPPPRTGHEPGGAAAGVAAAIPV
ncbi:MAG TPA: tRNA (adenosine(37)-N6)-threonylcarbamoyltransferase complex transferase subunit TsaD [Candidatus Binatia bacterium]|jgi:N6-L-threonylcarbamoyladenine synthase